MSLRQMDADTAETVAGVIRLLRRIATLGVSTALDGLRTRVTELLWEANTGAGA